ncbi:MAG TPA: protoporphyrinogen oxidase HemJ [Candidatus Sulfotelmatobacter sp.]|jgi:putative membrane protein|nr:protoporphyrinogen oxidase HemJ [Candidatus Sulfotelmatobacter sp.]
MSDAYLWFKAVHIMAVISWMAGLFYCPRLFVYHAGVAAGSEQSELFKVMERRLIHAITIPAAVVSWTMGLIMITQIGLAGHGWLHAKLVLVLAMTVFTVALERYRIAFAEDRNVKSEKFFRGFNEIPTLLMIGIVILVVVKPF